MSRLVAGLFDRMFQRRSGNSPNLNISVPPFSPSLGGKEKARSSERDMLLGTIQFVNVTPLSITALQQSAGETPVAAAVMAQLQAKVPKVTKTNKPYMELVFADSTGNFSLKVWSDSAAYHAVESLAEGVVLSLEGHWTQNQYGLDARDLDMSPADEEACEEFFAGDPELREKQDQATLRHHQGPSLVGAL